MNQGTIYVYGPPGSGKSAVGKELARQLKKPFLDLDEEIERNQQQTIPQIFKKMGEPGFRRIEKHILNTEADRQAVVALGGGTLLDPDNHAWAESRGQILFLDTPYNELLKRMSSSAQQRPLINDTIEQSLKDLLQQRSEHYAAFRHRIETKGKTIPEIAWQAQICLGLFHLSAMGDYDVHIQHNGLKFLKDRLAEIPGIGAAAIISDENVEPLYGGEVANELQNACYPVFSIILPAGEQHKSIETVCSIWDQLLSHGMGRDGLILALGGGVVSDLAGFSAATFLRGIRWVALPTTLLGMADASIGGKTGIDLPQGKNLAGAFHPPVLVLADPKTLDTLPKEEWRSGMAEVVKQGVVGDPWLFSACAEIAKGSASEISPERMQESIQHAMAVKIRLIESDPYEKNQRAALNFGHTIGHAIETALEFGLRHGEAVAIGMVLEAKLSEEIGLAESGISQEIEAVLRGLGLPVRIPNDIDPGRIKQALEMDKKKKEGVVRFALPVRIGEVKTGIVIEDLWRKNALNPGTPRP